MMNVPFQQVQTQVYIEFLNGPLVNQHFPLERAEIHIGSQQDNTIVIPDQSILPLHASLFWHEGRLAIQSRNAQASVTVNQAFIPAQGTYLNPDDVIGLGKSGIVFRLVSGKTLSAPHMAILPSTPGNTTVIRQTGSHAATSSQQAGQPHAGAAQAPTETTRYLCFAARIDEGFCNYVFRHIVGEKHRAIVESHGVDLVAVVKSCYAARKKVFTRDAVLCVLLAILLLLCIVVIASLSYIFMQAPLLVIIIVPLVLMLLIFLTLLVMLAHVKKIPLPIRVILLLIAILLLTYGTLFFLLLFLAAWAAILRHLWVTYYGAEAQQLRMGNLASETFQLPSDLEPELQRLSGLHENIIAYSGSSPFVGSGFAASDVDKDGVDGWSFAIDATKAKKEADVPEPFQMEELYRCVDQVIQALNLPGLSMHDKLYVNGKAISKYPDFFDDIRKRPKTQVEPALMKHFMEEFSEDVRYYKCIRVLSWKGELVFSTFIRFMKIGKTLFVETNYMVLPPLRDEYYLLDSLETTFTLRKAWDLMRSSFFSIFPLWFFSPLHVIGYLNCDRSARRKQEKVEWLIKNNPAFDYGASISLREVATSSNYQLHFQRLDKEIYVKIIERQLLESIIDFLDGKNIDTTDLKERQETILNNGVIVSGGSFSGNFAIGGEQAKVTVSHE